MAKMDLPGRQQKTIADVNEKHKSGLTIATNWYDYCVKCVEVVVPCYIQNVSTREVLIKLGVAIICTHAGM